MKLFCACMCFVFITCRASYADSQVEVSGYIELQDRYFFQEPLHKGLLSNQLSIALEPEWQVSLFEGKHLLSFKPFYRVDNQDSKRTHGDIRELMYIYVSQDWELYAGIGKEFWGVTESTHLVDIVNQTDLVESLDGEDKLGQPMLKLSLVRELGIFDFYVLPGFRERTFQGSRGRFQYQLPVDTEGAYYESDQKDSHIDYALRWSNTFDNLDIALSWFDGTSRDPLLFLEEESTLKELTLLPYYAQIQQVGLELQYIYLDWTFKAEAISREGATIDDYWALNSGFERTFFGVNDSLLDIGWLVEFQYDSRGALASSSAQKDIFIGGRISFNDSDSTEVLMGIVQDLDHNNTQSLLIESSSRFGESTILSLDLWLFHSKDPKNQLYEFRRDSFIQLSIQRYF